jgi:tetratricopeptide (TPR) repeat protein
VQEAGGAERASSVRQHVWTRWAGAAALLLLLVSWFLLRPRSGGGDVYLLHARALLGGMPPGQAVPEFPGSSSWIAYLIAAVEWSILQFGSLGDVTVSSALDRTEPSVRAWLPVAWSILAGCLVYLGGALAVRIARLATASGASRADAAFRSTPSAAPEDWTRGVDLTALVIRALALLLLALSPMVGGAVTSLSAALPAALILGWMTWRLLDLVADREQTRISIGAGVLDGLPAGALLAWAPFAWPAVIVYLASIRMAGASGARILSTFAIAASLGLVLDVSRLVDLAGVVGDVGVEWMREGGWPLLSGAFGTASLAEMLFGEPILLWIWIGALITCLALLRRGRSGLAIWIAGLFVLLRCLPAVAGVRHPGAVQASAMPLWILTASVAVAILPRARDPRPGWLYRALAVALLVGLATTQAIQDRRSAFATPNLAPAILQTLQQRMEPGDLCLLERALPGAESMRATFTLPRDSRTPERYDFAYWSRWYAGFRFVLVSETQLRQNLERDAAVPRHFYQRLATDGRIVAEYGDPVAYRLFELSPESAWRQPLTREELASLQPAPELGAFLSGLGSLYAEHADRRAAMILFEMGVRLDPESDALANNLGSIYLLEREWQEAARIFQSVLDRRPDSPEVLYNYARALFELNVFVRAETMYRRAIALRPDFAAAHYELARCFLQQDKKLLAAAALRRYLELEPNTPRRQEVEGVLALLAKEGIEAPPSGSGVEPEME